MSTLNCLTDIISEKLSKQLHISKDHIVNALKDETFILPILEAKKEQTLDPDIYIYDFYKGLYKQDKNNWKLKNIKLDDGLYYKLDLTTNLIYFVNKDNKYRLVGMKNKNNECR